MVFEVILESSESRYIAEWGDEEKKLLNEPSSSLSQLFSKN